MITKSLLAKVAIKQPLFSNLISKVRKQNPQSCIKIILRLFD